MFAKRFFSFFLALILVLGLLPTVQAAPADLGLYVAADKSAGLDGDVTVAISGRSGTVYLPGSADAAKCRLSWTGSAAVRCGGVSYESGKAPIPAPGQSLEYTVDGSTLTIRTLQGSAQVGGLFLRVDESLGTIDAMNRDRLKATVCYGTLSLSGVTYDMSMKGRGNTTWTDFDKKPYNITIYKDSTYAKKKSVSLIQGETSKKWSIISNAKDSTLLRNRVGLEMARQLGLGFETRFVDVWLNGEYRGNYLLTPKTDYQAPDGGYMLEIDNGTDPDNPQFSVRGFEGSRTPIFTVKDNGAKAATEEIQAWMQQVADAVNDTTSSRYLDYIDLESWARMYLLNEFYKTTDITSGSILMHRDGLTAGDKLIGGPIWDLDVSMGRAWPKSFTCVEDTAQMSGGRWFIDNINTRAWYQALGKHTELMERVYELYNEYKDVFDSAYDLIGAEDRKLSASADMNFALWDVNRDQAHNPYTCTRQITYDTGDYAVTFLPASTRADYLTNFKTYVEKRTRFLNDTLTVETPAGTVTGDRGNGQTVLRLALTAGGQNVRCRWQQSGDGETWTDIPGAQGPTCTVNSAQADENTQYRCIVRNCGQTIATQNVAAVTAGAKAVIGPVKLAAVDGHQWDTRETPPTCTVPGLVIRTCRDCGAEERQEIPALGHDYDTGYCTRCEAEDPNARWHTVTFVTDGGSAVTVYETQDTNGPGETPAETALARNGSTGKKDISGDGQVNFAVVPVPGARITAVEIAAGSENCKNLKELGEGRYRLTKITGDVTVTVKTEPVELPDPVCDGGDTCPGHGFTDMPAAGNWAHAGIDYCVSGGLMTGSTATTFAPGGKMSRAMLATVLYRKAGSPTVTAENPFADVPAGKYYTDAVIWANSQGIVTGKGAGKFAPNDNVTRQELVAMICRYASTVDKRDVTAKGDLSGFADAASVGSYAVSAAAWAVEKGILTGKDGKVAPRDTATRAEVAAILMRYCKLN